MKKDKQLAFSIVPDGMQGSTSSTTLTLSTLESHLWEAANILRGPVDAADFKTYIFPLLFFKRISDAYDEETTVALAESDGDQEYALFPKNHRFQIPAGYHWRDIRAHTTNVGQALQQAMREIEKANQRTLYGIFGDAQWTNKDRLSDALLINLIDHFSHLPLSNSDVDSDVLGQAYEYLIKKFADATNKKAGEFYTPRSVVSLMIRMLDPREGETIYDPACGTGGMLLESVHHVRASGGNAKTLWGKLYGQEKNLTTSGIARINLFLHGIEDFQIVRGDTLRQPAFFVGDRLATFDCVIANPPFSLERWGEDLWLNDPYGRNIAGVPPRTSGDFAWVQHMITSMASHNGRMAVVLPHGTLFRMGVEGEIRRKILDMDLLEAVIGLGPTLFYGTGLAACILIFRNHKAQERQGHVLIFDASKHFKKGRNQNLLLPEHIDQIFTLYKEYTDKAGIAKVVTLDEIARNDWNLNIPRYIEAVTKEETSNVAEALANLKTALDEAYAAEDRLKKLLQEAGLTEENK
ncbi:MAG: class I SAM-dependent DNA methyltransferase [Ktedonobacteraceae bacterium]